MLLNYLALVGVTTLLGFGLYTIGLKRLHASVAAITANTEVPFAAALAYIFLGERLDGWQMLGAALIILGVALISLPSSAQRRAAWRRPSDTGAPNGTATLTSNPRPLIDTPSHMMHLPGS